MAYRTHPDLTVPASEFRCEAMTKPLGNAAGYQVWRRDAHRCVRRAVQARAGRSVCALHNRVDDVKYWNGEADSFPKKVGPRRYAMPATTEAAK
jgi:hypothetical protein